MHGRTIRTLHTGDFRADESHLQIPELHAPLEYVFLDTTYLNPNYTFPPQAKVVEAISEFCRLVCVEGKSPYVLSSDQTVGGMAGDTVKKCANAASTMLNWLTGAMAKTQVSMKKRTLILVGSYTIGKEKVYAGMSCLY